MKVSYPASNPQVKLDDSQLALKIARHSPCSVCDNCPGLHPPQDVEVVLDEVYNESSLGDLGQYGSDDEDTHAHYLATCACSHGASQHNAEESDIGRAEFARRSRVAIRLDELLQDVGKLLDFSYIDDDISSLRRQMQLHVSLVSPSLHATSLPDHRFESFPSSPASSVLNAPHQPPTKKPRISTSPLSDTEDAAFLANALDDDDDDEEDRPLAARMAAIPSTPRPEKSVRITGKRSGKNIPQTAPISLPPSAAENPQSNGLTYGINGHNLAVKVEDMMDESQLTRLATGVTVDTAKAVTAGPPIRQEKAAAVELRKGVIQIMPVENDRSPRSLVILTGLKTLFQKQLPNMPREYISRLVYDANSKDLAIIKRGYKVVGGICYRPFPHRGFAEIVFFATASVDQEKGYGGILMDHFKSHIKRTYPDMMHFLTYADNYAVGYFEKQGFSKDITLDRSVWAAYIKDYEGGTIMQCTMLRKVDYLDKANIISQQQEAVMTKIRQMSKSHIVYSGLPQFQPGAPGGINVNPEDVPGLRGSGWNSSMVLNAVRPVPRSADNNYLARLLSDLVAHAQSWPFREPVKREDVPDYYDVIRNPMDFLTMQHKLDTNQYPTIESFLADTRLVFDNCRFYNPEGSIYSRNATKLEAYLKDELLVHRPG